MRTEQVSELLRQVAADAILPRFGALASDEVAEKKPGDFVTVADREAEEQLTAAFRQADPDALIVGEEATQFDHLLPRRLAGAEHAWVIDPVDGTRNFVNHNPNFAVMVAEVVDGRCVRGWIYQPIHEAMYIAEVDQGVTRNGEPLVRRGQHGARPSGVGYGRLTKPTPGLGPLTPPSGCAGYDYPRCAAGETDFIIYTSVHPWDHLAGTLMITENGGVARTVGGRRYDPAVTRGPLVVARDPLVWRTVVAALR